MDTTYDRAIVVKHIYGGRITRREQYNPPEAWRYIRFPNQDSPVFSRVTPPTASQEHCLLLNRLPAELREAIYRLVFHDEVIRYRYNLEPRLLESYELPHISGLLLTCKKMHFDAIRVFYATAIFQFYESVEVLPRSNPGHREEWMPPKTTKFWLLRIGKERARHVRHMRIFLDRHHIDDHSGDSSYSVDLATRKEVFDRAKGPIEVLAPQACLEINFWYGSRVAWTREPSADRSHWYCIPFIKKGGTSSGSANPDVPLLDWVKSLSMGP